MININSDTQIKGTSLADDLSFQHLLAELARIDILIQRQVWLWRSAGQDPQDAFRGLYISGKEAEALIQRPLATHWGYGVSLEAGESQHFADDLAQASQKSEGLVQTAHERGWALRLDRLATVFHLDQFDQDMLLLCLGPSLDLRYERLFGYLQDDVTRKRPTVSLGLDILCPPGSGRLLLLSHFSDEAPLFKYQILERWSDPSAGKIPLLSQTLSVDQAIIAWLLGSFQPYPELAQHTKLIWPLETENDRMLGMEGITVLEQAAPSRPIVVFHGPDQAAQQATARLFSARLGRLLMDVDLKSAIENGVNPQRAVWLAMRDARLTGALLYLDGWDSCLSTDTVSTPPAELLARLYAYPDMVILASRSNWRSEGVGRDRRMLSLDFPLPDFSQRDALWRYFLGQPQPDVTLLAGQFRLSASQIRDAVSSARDMAASRGGTIQI